MPKQTLAERFWSKVQRGHATECWSWGGLKDQRGRPAFYLSPSERTTAARVLWKLTYGVLPDSSKQWVRHRCENPGCVNPTHLVLVDRIGQRSRSGEHANNAKLTEVQARAILAARGKVTAKALAAQHGISIHTVKTIWRGQSWKHLREEEQ